PRQSTQSFQTTTWISSCCSDTCESWDRRCSGPFADPQHSSDLLPEHGGKGRCGIHVHESVLVSGDTETGVSIHVVSQEYVRAPSLRNVVCPWSMAIRQQRFKPVYWRASMSSWSKRLI